MSEPFATIEARALARGLDLVHPFVAADWRGEPALDDYGPEALGVLIGNSRAIWAPFLAARRVEANPLDAYVERSVTEIAEGVSARARFVHDRRAPLIPFQRLTDAVGLASRSPCQLCCHEVHGPWIALRAVLVIDAPGWRRAQARPCDGCEAPCVPAFERAAAGGLTREAVRGDWAAWAAVRDACPVGRSSRYSEAQLRYHYAGDASVLAGQGE